MNPSIPAASAQPQQLCREDATTDLCRRHAVGFVHLALLLDKYSIPTTGLVSVNLTTGAPTTLPFTYPQFRAWRVRLVTSWAGTAAETAMTHQRPAKTATASRRPVNRGASNMKDPGMPDYSVSVTSREGGKQVFRVSAAPYESGPGAGQVRVYYLPRSRHVVNLEVFADRRDPAPWLTEPSPRRSSAPGPTSS